MLCPKLEHGFGSDPKLLVCSCDCNDISSHLSIPRESSSIDFVKAIFIQRDFERFAIVLYHGSSLFFLQKFHERCTKEPASVKCILKGMS